MRRIGFDGVGNDIAAYQGIAHPVGAVADAIAYADGMENQSQQICFIDAFFYQFGQVVQVHIAGIAILAHAGNAYLCFFEIGFCKTRWHNTWPGTRLGFILC